MSSPSAPRRPSRPLPDASTGRTAAGGACHPSDMSAPPIATAAFHVRRTARERYAIEGPLLGRRGDLVVTDIAAIRHLAARMNVDRPPGAPSVGAGEIGALGLIHEIAHLL